MTVLDAGVERRSRRRAEIGVVVTCGLTNLLVWGTVAAFNVALPAMSTDLDGGIGTASWMVLGFVMANSSATLVFSKLSDEWGRRWFYFGGLLVFVAAAVLGALVESEAVLIGLRILQGLAAASSISNSSAVITDVFPPERLPVALGAFMAMNGVAALAGPVIGGVLIDHFGWRSIFWFSAVVGLLTVAVGWDGLKQVHAPGVRRFAFDVPGAITSVGGLGCLIYAVQLVGDPDRNTLLAGCLGGVAALLLAALVVVERASRHPLVDLAVVAGARGVVYGASFLASMAANGSIVLATLYLQVMEGASAAAAGAFLLPMGLALLVGPPLAGTMQRWVGVRTVTTVGSLTMGGGTALLALAFALSAPHAAMWPMTAAIGLGQGIFQAGVSARTMNGVAPNRRGVANGVRTTLINGSNGVSTALVIASITLMAGPRAIAHTDPVGARPAFVVAAAVLAAAALGAAAAS
ncbi:MAG: MFS transporter, partial [Nocardioides sp.]|uniref:MFS transporter n=1 Tax=Nocardioides sp. TaxID=35761 RepID=UPI0039E45252